MIKRVVNDNSINDRVKISETDEVKIYAFTSGEDIYKLQRIYNGRWAFVRLNDSCCWSNGSHLSVQEAIKADMEYDIYEFDSLAEFVGWLNENI